MPTAIRCFPLPQFLSPKLAHLAHSYTRILIYSYTPKLAHLAYFLHFR